MARGMVFVGTATWLPVAIRKNVFKWMVLEVIARRMFSKAEVLGKSCQISINVIHMSYVCILMQIFSLILIVTMIL